MANRACWKCGVVSHHKLAGAATKQDEEHTWYAPFICDECGAMSVGVWRPTPRRDTSTGAMLTHTAIDAAQAMDTVKASLEWHPANAMFKEYSDVPEHIATAAGEAHASYSIGARRAAVLMARSVVEATAKAKGITKGNLAAKIDELHDKDHVREMVRDQAHEIRYLGNDMAHGDFAEPVTEEDAEEVLALMDEVLEEVFQAPARLAARRAAREARRAREEQ